MEEISLVIEECTKLELASGVQLHRDPESGKVKILLLGDWRTNVSQEDIPFPFIRISPFLDCVGVKLYDNLFLTRQMNSELLVSKVTSMINTWKMVPAHGHVRPCTCNQHNGPLQNLVHCQLYPTQKD